MSRKIVYNINSTTQDRAVLIDDSNMTQKNGYWRFGDLISDENKKSNFRIIVSVGIFFIVFLLGYLTCHLMSPVSECHETLLSSNAQVIINDTNITNHNNDTEINITTIEPINNTKLVNSTTERSLQSTTENIHKIITDRTHVSINTTSTERVFKEHPFISVHEVTTNKPREQMKICLKQVTNRFEEIYGDEPEECVDEPIEMKSTIVFEPSGFDLFNCLLSKTDKCDHHFHSIKAMDKKMIGMKHIRYNFIMGDHGNLYEGRPLSCNLEENFFGYNNSQIIMGIPQCHKLDSEKIWEKFQFYTVINHVMECLHEEGILSNSYIMQFDEACKHYLPYSFLMRHSERLKFVKNDYYDEYDSMDWDRTLDSYE